MKWLGLWISFDYLLKHVSIIFSSKRVAVTTRKCLTTCKYDPEMPHAKHYMSFEDCDCMNENETGIYLLSEFE